MVSSIKWFHATPDNLTITLIKVCSVTDNSWTMILLMIFLTIHHMITISCTDGGLSRRPSHPLDPIRASLTLWNLLLCCGECPWTGNFLRDKDEELGLRLRLRLWPPLLCGREMKICVTENSNVQKCYTTCSSAQCTHEFTCTLKETYQRLRQRQRKWQ